MRRLNVCLLAALTLAACSDSPTGTDASDFSGDVTAFGTTQHLVSPNKNGSMTVTLTWGNPGIDLDLYLTDEVCTGYPPITCTILRSSDTGTNREEVTYPVLSGEQYKVWVDNFDELLGTSYRIQIDVD